MIRLACPQAVPEYLMSGFGHVFPKVCMYSHLIEPSQQNVTTCEKCESAKDYVREKRWNAIDVDHAMERLRKVLA
jgi:hypothetical protein